MSLLDAVRREYTALTVTKAPISHRPDRANIQHIFSSVGHGEPQAAQVGESFFDYATLYTVHPWVHKAITKTSEQIAPLRVRVVDTEDEEIEGHPLTELFGYINDSTSPSLFWQQWIIHMLLGGESFMEVVGDNKPKELWQWQPDKALVHPDMADRRYPRVAAYTITADDGPHTLDYRNVIHDKFYNPLSQWRGIAPITAVREGITIDLFAQQWSKRFLRGNARPDFAIVAPQGLTATERDRYMADFMTRHRGIENAHLPVILEAGVTDIKPFSFAPKDMEWLQQREFSRDEVAAIFGVPDEIMGYGKDTYENFEMAMRMFWLLTCKPLLNHRDSVLTQFFTKVRPMLKPGERVDTDLGEVSALQDDILPKVQAARTLYDMGVSFDRLDEVFGLGIGAIGDEDVGRTQQQVDDAQDAQNEQPAEDDGGSNGKGFFIPTGKITPEWVKALLLRLDDSDEEAEQKLRMALERRAERSIKAAFADMMDTLFPEGWGDFIVPELEAQRIHDEFVRDQQLRDAISRALQDGVDLGVSVAIDQFDRIGYGFDWTLAHVPARKWALAHTDDLLRQMATTTRAGTGQAIARWVDNGEPLQALINDLEPFFGPRRAATIAATEVTRAYAQGSIEAYKASEVVERISWQTANDERVCPVCGPLQGKKAPLGGDFGGLLPPAHPSCRCWILGVID